MAGLGLSPVSQVVSLSPDCSVDPDLAPSVYKNNPEVDVLKQATSMGLVHTTTLKHITIASSV